MGRTALNVNDSMLFGTGTARLTNHWDKNILTQMITAIYLQIKCKKVVIDHYDILIIKERATFVLKISPTLA